MQFEIINEGDVEFPKRGRKGSGKKKYQHKIWEYDNPKDQTRYLMALARMNARRQIIKNGEYSEEKNPYSRLVDERYAYEIALETVFLPDVDADEDKPVHPNPERDYDYHNDYDEDEEEAHNKIKAGAYFDWDEFFSFRSRKG